MLVKIMQVKMQVKIEIFAAGSSVAHAVFNATNCDKMDWMSSDRLLTSSWSDVTEYMTLKPVTVSVVGRYKCASKEFLFKTECVSHSLDCGVHLSR